LGKVLVVGSFKGNERKSSTGEKNIFFSSRKRKVFYLTLLSITKIYSLEFRKITTIEQC
jgi:hypothetical protein